MQDGDQTAKVSIRRSQGYKTRQHKRWTNVNYFVVKLKVFVNLGGQRLRDAETEEMIESMQTKLVELEQENGMLKNKVLICINQSTK